MFSWKMCAQLNGLGLVFHQSVRRNSGIVERHRQFNGLRGNDGCKVKFLVVSNQNCHLVSYWGARPDRIVVSSWMD